MPNQLPAEPIFNRVAIVGTGLIGGSIGMAIIGRNLAREVVGIDLRVEDLTLARETRAIHHGTVDLAEGVKNAELVILAIPVGSTLEMIKCILPNLMTGAILTDVGSTKAAVVEGAEDLIDGEFCFVGGHPMAGSEQAGIKGADRYLLENAAYILTPTDKTDPTALAKVRELVEAIGSRVMYLDPREHDLLVAAVSHLPHVVAAALVNAVGRIQDHHPQTLLLAAGGFRDTTRIAASHPVMWRDICLTNREAILETIGHFKKALDEMEEEIRVSDGTHLREQFDKAQALRNSIPARQKGYLPVLHEIVVTIPDRPGMIAEVAHFLGRNGINIVDIEILRVREGEGGTLRVGLDSEENLEAALLALNEQGIVARQR